MNNTTTFKVGEIGTNFCTIYFALKYNVLAGMFLIELEILDDKDQLLCPYLVEQRLCPPRENR